MSRQSYNQRTLNMYRRFVNEEEAAKKKWEKLAKEYKSKRLMDLALGAARTARNCHHAIEIYKKKIADLESKR